MLTPKQKYLQRNMLDDKGNISVQSTYRLLNESEKCSIEKLYKGISSMGWENQTAKGKAYDDYEVRYSQKGYYYLKKAGRDIGLYQKIRNDELEKYKNEI